MARFRSEQENQTKIMEIFSLEEWELPPGCNAPLAAEADEQLLILCEGRQRLLMLRVVELSPRRFIVFFRDPQEQGGQNRLVLDKKGKSALVLGPHRPTLFLRQLAEDLAAKKSASGRIFRFDFPFSPHSPSFYSATCVVVGEVGYWLNRRLVAVAEFRLFESDAGGSHQLRHLLWDAWQDENSDFRFSRRWLAAHTPNRAALLYGAELTWVMKRILFCHPTLWVDCRECHWMMSAVSKSNRSEAGLVFKNDEHLPLVIDEQEPYFSKFSVFLRDIYLPLLVKEKVRLHRCIAPDAERLMKRGYGVSFGRRPAPEEQIQVASELRNWLPKHNAPAELLVLLNR